MATRKPKKEPVPEVPKTFEELCQLAKDGTNNRADSRYAAIPPMNYPHKAGDKVMYGNRPECLVEEILDKGMVLISYADKGESYGRPYDNHRRIPAVIPWVSLLPFGKEEDTNFTRPRVRTQHVTTMLESLMHTVYHRGIIDSPEYQRGYVWTMEDKRKLLKTIFDRNDIGKFLTVSHPYPENRIEIIDGKQRLRAIMDYLEGRFDYHGKFYWQLSFNDKMAFHELQISIIEIQSEYVRKSDILWLFLTANTGGVPQTEEHLAIVQAMYEAELAKEGPKDTDDFKYKRKEKK